MGLESILSAIQTEGWERHRTQKTLSVVTSRKQIKTEQGSVDGKDGQ